MLLRMNPRRRRILMTVDAIGGIWQYALALTKQLVAAGDFVILAGLGPPPTSEQKRQAKSVAPLEWLRTPPDWIASREEELESLNSELAHLIDEHAIELVQVNEPGQAADLVVPCPLVAVSHSCVGTWFHTVRGAQPPHNWAWHEKRTRIGMNRADLLIAPSASHATTLAKCYAPLGRVIVVHNATTPCAEVEKRDDIVFAAGRWWDDGKNGRVLDGAALHTHWPVFAAGATTGPNGDSIVFRNVVSLGPISNTETRNLAARCGIFVSPSIYEPFGLAALEAAASGTPLVLADIPTYRELWSDAAIFFPPHDPASLAKELNRLAADDSRRRELGAAARRRSRSYALQKQATTMRSAYDAAAEIFAGRA